MNTFNLSKAWFEFAFENDVKPQHAALYFFIIDKANRSGWKEKTDVQTGLAMEATGIGSHKTYKCTLEDLHKWGFIQWVYRAKNQYKCNQVILKRFEHIAKALTKADAKHLPKQVESDDQSSASSVAPYINIQTSKPLNSNNNKGKSDEKNLGPENDKPFITCSGIHIQDLPAYLSERFAGWYEQKQQRHGKDIIQMSLDEFIKHHWESQYQEPLDLRRHLDNYIPAYIRKYNAEKQQPKKREFRDYLSEAEETKKMIMDIIENDDY